MKTILVPVDFSPVTRDVVRAAARLARQVKGRLVLVHSVQMPVVAVEPYGLGLGNIGEYMAEAEKAAKRHLARMRLKLRAANIPTDMVCTTGLPSYSVVAVAKKRGADYIVIGSHGHTALYDMFVGSTTRGVLKHAACPVVVVPTPPKKSRKSAG